MSAVPVEDVWQPAFLNVPPRDGSLVRAVEGVAAKVGRTLDPPQRQAIDVLTSSWRSGKPATLEAAIIAPRQNLKTYCLENIVLARLTAPGPPALVVWSAHEVATAQETFRTFIDLAERFAWLGEKVSRVSRSPGRESIEFEGKRRLRFRARIKTGGRGLSGDLIVLDEAFALEPAHMGSLLPILSTRKRAQVIYGSSAPLATSATLRGVMERGREGGPGAPAYVEHKAPGSFGEPGCVESDCYHKPGTVGCALDDEANWLAANCAAPGRISLDYIRAERLALTPLEFARERLSWGEDAAGASDPPFTLSQFELLTDPESRTVGPVALAAFISPDRDAWAIGVAGRRADGLVHIGLGGVGSGGPALAQRLIEVRSEVALRRIVDDKASREAIAGDDWTVGPIAGLLRDAGCQPLVWSATEVRMACAALKDAVIDRQVRHSGRSELLAAVKGAVPRNLANGWVYDYKKSADVPPLMAVVLAHRALLLSESAPGFSFVSN